MRHSFELGRVSFFQSAAYKSLFEHLDASGGFFYERLSRFWTLTLTLSQHPLHPAFITLPTRLRWGDAPVHSLAAAALLPRTAVAQLDVGYQHDDW